MVGYCLVLYQEYRTEVHQSTLLSTHVLKFECSDCDLDTTLKAFWDLDTLGIKDNESSVYEDFIQTIDFKNGRYCVHLPWKNVHTVLSEL